MMRLWLLAPITPAQEPFAPWFDKAFGFVVRALDETDARFWASENAGDEGADAWLNPAITSCAPLEADGVPGVVLRDFASA